MTACGGSPASLDLGTLRARYLGGGLTPTALVDDVLGRVAAADPYVWITRTSAAELRARARALERARPEDLPLYGVPFAVKDNVDLAGVPTTAGCPAFAYVPETSAPVVQRLLDAGAIAIGKTNLDQFAAGLVGIRTPYGVPGNSFDPAYVPGGSSSGSAVALASGLVSFAIGTDTAGSGRVPAAFNNVVGLKPTRGLLSARGVVPACRSLDCVSLFALSSDDAADLLAVVEGADAADPFSRARPSAVPMRRPLRVGLPRPADLDFFGDDAARALFAAAVERLGAADAEPVAIDLTPFLAAARLLYEGPWVAERYAAIRDFFDRRPGALHPVTRAIIETGRRWSAADAALASYELRRLARETEAAWRAADVLLVPTAGTIYRIADVAADPVRLNANLGRYTNFVNLLDLCALAVPAGFRPEGLPFGVTLTAPAFAEHALLALGDVLHRASGVAMGATGHALPPPAAPDPEHGDGGDRGLRGAPGGAAAERRAGAPRRRPRDAHADGAPPTACTRCPAARRLARASCAPPIEPVRPSRSRCGRCRRSRCGSFLAGIPAPLAIGTLELADGRWVKGFLCEGHALAGATDVTRFGGWRAYQRMR